MIGGLFIAGLGLGCWHAIAIASLRAWSGDARRKVREFVMSVVAKFKKYRWEFGNLQT